MGVSQKYLKSAFVTVVRFSCIFEFQLQIFVGLPTNLEILDDLSMHLLAL